MSIVFRPLTNHLLLRLEPEPELSRVIAVQRATEGLARFGQVTQIGPEVRDIIPGDRVLASITAGVEIQQGLIMVAESAVLGVERE